MNGDRYENVHITWRHAVGVGRRRWMSWERRCIGTVEHIGIRTILIRRPRGGLIVKRMGSEKLTSGWLAARIAPEATNLLLRWLDDDDKSDAAKAARFAAAAERHAAEDAEYLQTVTFVL